VPLSPPSAIDSGEPSTTTEETFTTTTETTNLPQQLRDAGLDYISIAFPTHDKNQYEEWMMNPQQQERLKDSSHQPPHPWDQVCDFVGNAVKARGLQVELTAVARPELNQARLQEFVQRNWSNHKHEDDDDSMLSPPIRWRPYFE